MTISERDWSNYIRKLRKLSDTVADKVKAYIERHGLENTKELIDYSYALVSQYGEGAAALSAQMYDILAELEGRYLEPAEMAPTATYGEVAKSVNGTLKTSQNPNEISGAVSRWVKMAGSDTTLKNAERDGAQFAWIPSGDTCAFCLTLASRGWQNMSKAALKHGHAEHIHSHCDCQYAVRFDSKSNVAGYDPDRYRQMYDEAEGDTPQEKINAMRRAQYEENKDLINAQKRAAYEKRKEREKHINSLKYSSADVNIDVEEINIPRSFDIDNFDKIEQFHERFPSVLFEDSFDNSGLETQKEIAQGLELMRSLFGDEMLPRKLAVVKMRDYGSCSANGRICIKKGMNAGYTLLTTCHECIHRLDDLHGDIAEDVLRQAYKAIGARIGGKEAKQALVKSIGYQAYLKYNAGKKIRFDEQMAWSFESSLHDKEDRLGKAVFSILKERFGV